MKKKKKQDLPFPRPSKEDPLGSYTGVPAWLGVPQQDADDL